MDEAMQRRVMREIIEPVLKGMRDEGTPYCGFLYAGLMLTCDGPKVIEFNVRFGDPEAQAVMPLVESDLHPVLTAAADGALDDSQVEMRTGVSVGVVLASEGYPGTVRTGQRISGLEDAARVAGVTVFHAGTSMMDNHLVTAGGRVLTIVGVGSDYDEARARAYEAVGLIHFDGMQYRHDIGVKAL